MRSDFNANIAAYLDDERAVLVFDGGQVVQVNDVCRSLSEGLDLLGYELEYIVGEEIAEIVTADLEEGSSFDFSNFLFSGHRGHLHILCSGGCILFFFAPVYGREERSAMQNYKQYIRRLVESSESAQSEYAGGENERFERLPELDIPLSRADIGELRVQRRVEQIRLLERCFESEPISGELDDVSAVCSRTLSGCAALLNDGQERIIFRNTNPKVLERVFNHDEVERMFSCLLTGSLAMCGDEPLEVTVSVSEDTLCIDLRSAAEGFNDIGFAKAMRLPLETEGFEDTGRGLELLLASEIANRYSGSLQFYRSGGVGRLSAFISPSFYGMEYDLYNAATIASSMYPQYIIELSEML